MITGRLFYFLAACSLLFAADIVWLLIKKRIILKYSLIWFFFGIVMIVLTLVPGIAVYISDAVGIKNHMNCIYFFLDGGIILILVSLTVIVSELNSRARKLAQECAKMEKRIREMEACEAEMGLEMKW